MSWIPTRESWARIAKEAIVFVCAVVILFSARSSLADHYVVPSSSMEHTLMPGDRVVVNKMAFGLRVPFLGWSIVGWGAPKAGEVVVFDSPESGKRLIKRVVATAGQRVSVRRGHLRIDGADIALPDEPDTEAFGDRIARLNLSLGGGPDFGPMRIEEGYLLVMGDFRGNSRDGREFGLIRAEEAYGRAIAVYLRRGEGLVWKGL